MMTNLLTVTFYKYFCKNTLIILPVSKSSLAYFLRHASSQKKSKFWKSFWGVNPIRCENVVLGVSSAQETSTMRLQNLLQFRFQITFKRLKHNCMHPYMRKQSRSLLFAMVFALSEENIPTKDDTFKIL